MIQIVSIITVNQTEDAAQAVQAVREAVAQINFGSDGLIVLTTSQGRDSIGAMATRTLEGLATELNRSLVIRCNDQFVPSITDYPSGDGRPYPVSLNVSEIAGMYRKAINE